LSPENYAIPFLLTQVGVPGDDTPQIHSSRARCVAVMLHTISRAGRFDSDGSRQMQTRFCMFQAAPTGLLGWLLQPNVFQHISHMERLSGLCITSFHYVPATDELEVSVSYRGQCFMVSMAWGGDLYLSAGEQVPEELFRHVCLHMKAYRRVWPLRLLDAGKRYARIAKSAG
jgi:hypothetical protein